MKYETMIQLGRLESEIVTGMFEKALIVDEVFALLRDAYAQVKGGLLFPDQETLLSTTAQWNVIYLDERLVGVIVYKAKQGLKMVAMGIAREIDRPFRTHVKRMLSTIFQWTFRTTWMEVSEGAERFLLAIGGERFVIPNVHAQELTGKAIVALDADGKHYYREINGILKRKLILGTIRNSRQR